MLIAITGKALAGKDTAASVLIKELDFSSMAFAEPLKDSCIHKFNLSYDDVYTQAGKKRYVPEWGLTVGEILQQEGTEATKPYWGEDFWVKRWKMTYDIAQRCNIHRIVLTDCRVDVEAQALVELGGRIIRVIRPGETDIGGRDPNHVSEQGISDKYVHSVIHNDGSVNQLKQRTLELVKGWGLS